MSRAALVRIMLGKPGTSHAMTDDDVTSVASATRGYSGADLASLCQEAAMVSIRELSRNGGFNAALASVIDFAMRLCFVLF